MGKIIALVNQKGGVGKTTSSINLAASLGVMKQKVLLVDLDPQGNATTGLGINKAEISKSVYDLLIDQASLKEVIIKSNFRNLYVMPATINLAGADIELMEKK
jgi:chromosome partitioning protein